jgi:hypothetical protein
MTCRPTLQQPRGFDEALCGSCEARDDGAAGGLELFIVAGALEVAAAAGQRQFGKNSGEGWGSGCAHAIQAGRNVVGGCAISQAPSSVATTVGASATPAMSHSAAAA